MNLMEQIARASRQMENAERIKAAIGAALTPEQQLAVSARVADGPAKFIAWCSTNEGRAAIKELADKFIAAIE